jgi:NADH-quinone oxidoreductase subunit J
MNWLFIVSSIIAVVATLMVVTRANIIHALLYFVVSLMAVSLIFYLLGAPFIAALEVIIYAGAIVVLIVFAVMLMNPKVDQDSHSPEWARPSAWIGPSALTFILGIELLFSIYQYNGGSSSIIEISPQQVGMTLYGQYLLGVEMVSVMLLAGLVSAYHLGRQQEAGEEKGDKISC